MVDPVWLKKYTKLEYLPDILKYRQLYLGKPSDWEDENDRALVELYSNKSGGQRIRATCLTEARDRFHFWAIFGERNKGVCLWFDKEGLRNDINRDTSLVADNVRYLTLKELPSIERDDVPFAKREQYRDEREFRVLRNRQALNIACDKFAFSASSLKRIYLNPWLCECEVRKWRSDINAWLAGGFKDVKVLSNRSLRYERWIEAAKSVLN